MTAVRDKYWPSRLHRSVRRRGVLGSFRWAVAMLAFRFSYRFLERWEELMQLRFDHCHNVDTCGRLFPEDMRDDPRYSHSHSYGTCSSFGLRRILKLLRLDHQRFTFVDIGCGKGKALLLAAEWPFGQVVGVEISSELLRVAENNVQTCRGLIRACKDIRLVCEDAAAFSIPSETAVVCFFNNPFEEPLMRTVLENIGKSVAAFPRDVWVIYKHPSFRAMADALPFLSLVRESPWYCLYRVLPSPAPHAGKVCP
jgi:SAM-dependent methyltransferase